jgi:hypothetical protein
MTIHSEVRGGGRLVFFKETYVDHDKLVKRGAADCLHVTNTIISSVYCSFLHCQ